MIERGFHELTGIGEKCSMTCRIWCWLGLHRWSDPGGYCECCGKKDRFFD